MDLHSNEGPMAKGEALANVMKAYTVVDLHVLIGGVRLWGLVVGHDWLCGGSLRVLNDFIDFSTL